MSHVQAMFLLVQQPQVERFSKHPTCKGQNGATFWHSPWPGGWRKWMNNIWKNWENQLLFKACFVCSFYFILWCSTFKCTSSKTLDSRLSTGLPGRKRGFCLHLCPDWMLVGSWFEVFKCYSCSWQAETWSGSSVLLSNFSLSTQFGKMGHHGIIHHHGFYDFHDSHDPCAVHGYAVLGEKVLQRCLWLERLH